MQKTELSFPDVLEHSFALLAKETYYIAKLLLKRNKLQNQSSPLAIVNDYDEDW